MALSEAFPPESSKTIERPGRKTVSTKIPITARELVEWTYAVQRAQGVRDITLEPQGRSQTGIVVDRMTEYRALGCKIDRSSNAASVWGETRCHEDAITVHSTVAMMHPRQRFLLIDHGKRRSIPEWSPKLFPLRCVPVMGKRGSGRGLYLGSGRELVGHEITYEGDWPDCDLAARHQAAAEEHKRVWSDQHNWPVARRRRCNRPMVVEHEWSPEPYRRCADEVLQRARDEYRTWYDGLWTLCDGLEAAGMRGLSRYRVSGIGAACEPWSLQKKTDR